MRIGLIGTGRIGALHAESLSGLPGVDGLVVTDTDAARAWAVADKVGAEAVPSVADLLAGDVSAVVIAAPTGTHADLIRQAARAGRAVFCEKPVAADAAGTRAVLAEVTAVGISLHVAFQRRFDAGYRAARAAVREGRLGRLHTMRACTSDPAPPPASYIRSSGGIFKDCSVHDFDAVRWVTGREIVEVYATGGNGGDPSFAAAGDVDTAVTVLTLDDGTLVVCTATRYNGAGYDARLEVCGSVGTLVAGLDDHAPLVSAEGAPWPAGRPYGGFMERFKHAYVAQLAAFVDVVAGRPGAGEGLCSGTEALSAMLVAEAADRSRSERLPVMVEGTG